MAIRMSWAPMSRIGRAAAGLGCWYQPIRCRRSARLTDGVRMKSWGWDEFVARTRRASPGQAIVEFGIVALLLVLIIFAVVDFGLLLNGWLGVSAAARQGARQAAVGLS